MCLLVCHYKKQQISTCHLFLWGSDMIYMALAQGDLHCMSHAQGDLCHLPKVTNVTCPRWLMSLDQGDLCHMLKVTYVTCSRWLTLYATCPRWLMSPAEGAYLFLLIMHWPSVCSTCRSSSGLTSFYWFCIDHLFVVGVVETRLCAEWNLTFYFLSNTTTSYYIISLCTPLHFKNTVLGLVYNILIHTFC